MAGAVCFYAARRASRAWGIVLAGVLAGWVLWTLFEYILHRWLLHHTRLPFIRRMFWEAFHKEHHSYKGMKDPEHHAVHPAVTVPLALLVVVLVAFSTSGGLSLAVASGWLLGYCSYEGLHWLFHSASPEDLLVSFAPLKRLREAHTVHHLHRASANYGFLTQFWDRQFGTSCPLEETAEPSHTADAV